MNIDFKIEANKEYNSTITMTLSNIKVGDSIIVSDVKYYLTEKDLTNLIKELYNKREDIFESEGFIKQSESEVEFLRDRVKELEEENQNLYIRVDELEEENDDLYEDLANT